MAVTRQPRWSPWAGLVAAAAAWGLHHQVVSDGLHFSCTATSGPVDVVLGLLALGGVAVGAFVSWRAWPRAGESADGALRRFVVALSLMGSLLAAIGIGLQAAAGVILPGCAP